MSCLLREIRDGELEIFRSSQASISSGQWQDRWKVRTNPQSVLCPSYTCIVHVCAHSHRWTSTHIQKQTHTCQSTCVSTLIHMNTNTYTETNTSQSTSVFTLTQMNTNTYMSKCMCVHTHTDEQEHIHGHKHKPYAHMKDNKKETTWLIWPLCRRWQFLQWQQDTELPQVTQATGTTKKSSSLLQRRHFYFNLSICF